MLNIPVHLLTTERVTQRRINWRQEYAHLALMVMTACWLAPWVAFSLGWLVNISLTTAFELTLVHLTLSTLLVRWLHHRRSGPGLQLSAVLLLMWAAAGLTLLVIPSVVYAYKSSQHLALADLFSFDRQQRAPAGPLIGLWVLFLWWRGYELGSGYLTAVRASFGIRLGILSFVIILMCAGRVLRSDTLSLVPAFFFFGLLSSTLARANSLDLDRAGRFGRGWILLLAGLALLLTLGGYGAALGLAGMDMSRAAEVFTLLGEGVLTVAAVIFSPLLLVAQAIYNVLDATIPDQTSTILQRSSNQPGSGPVLKVQSPWIGDVLHWMSQAVLFAVGIFILVALLAFVWFLLVARSQRAVDDDEEREPLGTGELTGGLQHVLRGGWQRLMGLLGLVRQFGLGHNLFAALTIRRIYARMERLAARRGYPRALSETPYEYRRVLGQAFPGLDEAIHAITEAYISVRYGEIPENEQVVQTVRLAWEQLQQSPGAGEKHTPSLPLDQPGRDH